MGLAGLRQGTQYLKPSSGKRKLYTPFISWKNGESKTVAFLTPIDEVAKVRMHDFVKVPADNEKGWKFDHFMCRKDPAWMEESGGECYLCDVIGAKVSEKHTAIGVELEPITDGKTPHVLGLNVVTRSFTREDGTEALYPQWGLVRQSFGNFYNYLTAFGQKWGGINHIAFDIARIGSDKTTSYVFMNLMGVDLPDFTTFSEPIPNVFEVLEKMGSKEKYETSLQGAEELDQTPDYDLEDDTNSFAPAETTGAGIKTMFDQLKATLPANVQDKLEPFTN